MKWVPPPQGWFKANVDGAIFKETNKAGIGVVVHDSQGWVLAIKALAIRWAIRFAIETSFSCVIIDSSGQNHFTYHPMFAKRRSIAVSIKIIGTT